jgi:hypothetical protein
MNTPTPQTTRPVPESSPVPFQTLSWVLYCLLVAALLGFALTRAVLATHECLWPIGWDLLRDVGMGQTLVEGRYPEDPILLGETLWYNPLTGAILALGNILSGISMPRLGVLLGPWVNLAAPLGLVIFVTLLFGRAAGLAGMCIVLFGKAATVPIWVHFWYSPWLFPSLYGAGIMLLVFAVYYKALERHSYAGYAGTGLLLGLAFMAHTAPAVVAGGALLLCSAWEIVCLLTGHCADQEGGKADRALGRRKALKVMTTFGLMLAVAFLTSLPYTGSILWNYQFRVQSPAPSLFALDYVLLEQLPDRLVEALNWRNAFAVLGAVALLYRRDRAARLGLCWTLTVVLLFVQHYTWQLLERRFAILVPGIVPGHHWSIHLTAVRAMLFGVGVAAAGGLAADAVRRLCSVILRSAPASRSFPVFRQGLMFVAACVAGLLLYAMNPLTTHLDFQKPDMTLYHEYHQRSMPLYEWILENTPPDAVFICHEDEIAVTIVMPAARKLLFPPYIYCNPFVDPGPLSYVNRILVEPAMAGDAEAFCAERQKYSAVYMIMREEELIDPPAPFNALFEEVYRAERLVLFTARPCT